jgi:4-amino-4-deoxy-L-arabinose transferase-like glycosyltransferase
LQQAVRARPVHLFAIVALLIAIGAFQIATLRAGHDWGGDFSLYILHARNIAEGRSYGDTGYIYNPAFPEHSPRAYPPVFPVLLAPVYKLRGLDFAAMKVEVIVFFVLSLFIFFHLLRGVLSVGWSLAVVALSGLNPVVWDFKDQVLPDTAFMLFAYLSLYLIGRWYERPHNKTVLWCLLTGTGIYVACATRSIGLVLLPTLLVYDFLRKKRPSLFAIGSVAVAVLLILAQNAVIHNDESYFDQLRHHLSPIISHLRTYGWVTASLWNNGYSSLGRQALFLVWAIVAAVGVIWLVRQRTYLPVIFALGYLAALLVWPGGVGTRYIIPLVPFYFTFIVVGLERSSIFARLRSSHVPRALLAGSVLFSYAGAYARTNYGPIADGILEPEFNQACSYIRSHLAPSDIIVCWNPRVLALFTERRSAAYEPTASPDVIWHYLESLPAPYVLLDHSEPDRQALRPMIDRYGASMSLEYRNPKFELYRVGGRVAATKHQ